MHLTTHRYGRLLVETCKTFRGAENEVTERAIRLQSHWKRTAMQLDFITRIWASLDEEHQDIQTQILQVLLGKLAAVISKLESTSKKKSDHPASGSEVAGVKKWKYVLIKQYLDEAIEDLASWQKMFDPSWFLIMKVSSPFIDQELHQGGLAGSSLLNARSLRNSLKDEPNRNTSIFLPKEGLRYNLARQIPFSTARCIQRTDSDSWLVIDSIPCDRDVDKTLLIKDVRQLARKLSSMDPFTFGILQCRGVIRITDDVRTSFFDFAFKIPKELGSEPKGLRYFLTERVQLTLTERVQLAMQLAKSISFVHTLGFVHKNFRPETILGFRSGNIAPGVFVLVGFEKVRMADGRTRLSGDLAWEKNIYRHPQRQGLFPEEVYTMQHDIYSLGVCLLEIGLWESFVLCKDDSDHSAPGTVLELHLQSPEFQNALLMKKHLVGMAHRELPTRIGEKYKEVVVNCLTCLDEENIDFGNQKEFEDEDGVLIGVRYIEKVCSL